MNHCLLQKLLWRLRDLLNLLTYRNAMRVAGLTICCIFSCRIVSVVPRTGSSVWRKVSVCGRSYKARLNQWRSGWWRLIPSSSRTRRTRRNWWLNIRSVFPANPAISRNYIVFCLLTTTQFLCLSPRIIQAFFDKKDRHIFTEFKRAGDDLCNSLEGEDRAELEQSLATLETRWKVWIADR